MPGTELELAFETNPSIGVPFSSWAEREREREGAEIKSLASIIILWKYFITTSLYAPPIKQVRIP